MLPAKNLCTGVYKFLHHTWSVYSFTLDTTSVNETLAHFLLFLPQETQNVDTNPPAASDQPQCDFHKPPEKLLCAQCRRILKTTPEVVQKKVCWICRLKIDGKMVSMHLQKMLTYTLTSVWIYLCVCAQGKINFVCSLACSEEFKRVNNIMGKCEYCKNERIIKDVKKVDNKDCYFCSDGKRKMNG